MATQKYRFFIDSVRKGPRFEVVKLNRETLMATLKGETGVPFDKCIDDDSLAKHGYRLVKLTAESVEEHGYEKAKALLDAQTSTETA